MLVLSRKEQEAIVFPKLGIRVEVTRVRGKAVSLGIVAPDQVRVLRGEIEPWDTPCDPAALANASNHAEPSETARRREHELRNRINTLTIALHLIRKKADKNRGAVDEDLLAGAIDELSLIEEALQDKGNQADLDAIQDKASLPLALVVDDNENESTLLAGFLRATGFRVATALDGQAALRLIESGTTKPDIVLLDMNMPGLDGRGTIEAIRSNPKINNLRVFAVSGESEQSSGVSVGTGGVDRWFRKPIRPDHLVSEMSKQLRLVSA